MHFYSNFVRKFLFNSIGMKIRVSILFVFCLILNQTLDAQDSIPEFGSKKKESFLTETRHWNIGIPIWIPGFRGEFAYGDVELEGEDNTLPTPENPIEKPGFGDVFKRLFKTGWDLNYFFITSVMYTNKKFYSELDMFSGTVGVNLKFRYNNKKLVSVKTHSDLLRLYAGYKLYEHNLFRNRARYNLFGYGGIRFQKYKLTSDLDGIGKTLKVDPLWIEPALGVRNELVFDDWKFLVQADMGSFGIDDKFSYMLNYNMFYRISNLLSFKLGWNAWYFNYNDRFKDESVKLKVHLAGPVGALVFNF